VRPQFTQPRRVDPVHENEVVETRKCDFEKHTRNVIISKYVFTTIAL
jgi:hypothetical protein